MLDLELEAHQNHKKTFVEDCVCCQKEYEESRNACGECSVRPIVVDLFRFVDDRGTLDQVFNSDLPFGIKRIYTTVSNKGVIRGLHGHHNEWKTFYVSKGSIKIITFRMPEPEIESDIKIFVLNETKPQILILPPNFYHGYVSLSDESRVIIFSSATLEETKKDDHRVEPNTYLSYFEVKGR
jgi:dTDP-4-dehydrorhamnose 3,5-epimerase